MSIEAMKLALEAFAYMPNEIIKQNGVQMAITSLRQAIADAEKQPKREWVGLTDEDDIAWDGTGNLKQLVESVEAKLKEKNT